MKKKISFILVLSLSSMLLVTGCDSGKAESTESTEVAESAAESENSAAKGDKTIDDSIAEILDNDDQYPDITAIDYNDDFTEFTITLEADTMNIYESMLVMSFYTFGDEKQSEAGVPESDVLTVVRYVNGSTGDVISESDSSSMVTE